MYVQSEDAGRSFTLQYVTHYYLIAPYNSYQQRQQRLSFLKVPAIKFDLHVSIL